MTLTANITDQTLFTSPLADIAIPDVTVHDHIRQRARAFGSRPALVDANSGDTVTYAELDERIARVASALVADGLQKGDVVAIYSPNCTEFPIAALGVMAAGGVVTLVNPLYQRDELAHQLNDSGATRIVAFSMFLPHLEAVADQTRLSHTYVLHGDEGGTPFAQLLNHHSTQIDVDVSPTDLAALPYSSGTTGRSKGVRLTHANIVANLHQGTAMFQLNPDDRAMAFLPMFHIFGFVIVTMASLHAGAEIVTIPMFEPKMFCEAIERHRITVVFVVPPVMKFLAMHPMVDEYDLASVEILGCGAAPLGAEVEAMAAERLDCLVAQGYGMTEVSGASTMPFVADRATAEIVRGSSYQLVPNTQALIVDPETGRSLGPNETGELWVRGANTFDGYLNNQEATDGTIDADGWLHTGDLCHFDDRGYLFVTDRLKELIKVKGFQVAPAELEALLITHPMIVDAAVIGRPDDRSGEVPIAFIVTAGDVEHDEVKAFVAEQVIEYKHLADVITVDEIPKNPSGKILRRELRDIDQEG